MARQKKPEDWKTGHWQAEPGVRVWEGGGVGDAMPHQKGRSVGKIDMRGWDDAKVEEWANRVYALMIEHRLNRGKVRDALGLGFTAYANLKDRYPKIGEAEAEARQDLLDSVAEVIWRGGLQDPGYGKVHQDAMFVLKTQAGWSEKQVFVHETFDVPAAEPAGGGAEATEERPGLTLIQTVLGKVAGGGGDTTGGK